MIVPVERFREKYREKYRKERFEEGRKEGERDRAISDIRDVLEIRFALSKTHPIAARIAAIEDSQRLKQLHRTALQVSDLEAFEQALDT